MINQVVLTGVMLTEGWFNGKAEFEVKSVIAEEKPKTYKLVEGRLFGDKVLNKQDEGKGKPAFQGSSAFTAFAKEAPVSELKEAVVTARLEAYGEEIKRLLHQIAALKVKTYTVKELARQEGIEIG